MDSILSDQTEGWTNITNRVAIYITLLLTSTYDEYRLCLMPIMKRIWLFILKTNTFASFHTHIPQSINSYWIPPLCVLSTKMNKRALNEPKVLGRRTT